MNIYYADIHSHSGHTPGYCSEVKKPRPFTNRSKLCANFSGH